MPLWLIPDRVGLMGRVGKRPNDFVVSKRVCVCVVPETVKSDVHHRLECVLVFRMTPIAVSRLGWGVCGTQGGVEKTRRDRVFRLVMSKPPTSVLIPNVDLYVVALLICGFNVNWVVF